MCQNGASCHIFSNQDRKKAENSFDEGPEKTELAILFFISTERHISAINANKRHTSHNKYQMQSQPCNLTQSVNEAHQ